jgi:serine phosphatase RsbU (regulator of sigma subunit)
LRTNFYSLLVLLVIQSTGIYGQYGDHFVQNYLPKNYEAAANNNGVTQNNDGLVFVANQNGVLIFDGINWEHCKRWDEVAIQSIAKTENGEIVVGSSDGDIAVIFKNAKGKFRYKSILDKLPKEKRPQEIIRQIVTVGPSTYFLSADKLVEYKNSALKSYEPASSFHARALVMGKHVFVCDVNANLCVLQNGVLKPVRETERLSAERYFFCYKLNSTTYAVGYRNIGVYIAKYDSIHPENTKFSKRISACDAELISAEINNGSLLGNGNFIVTTNKKGAFELDTTLKITDHFDTGNGVYDDNIKSAFQDLNGNLWLALYYGVAFVETNSRLFQYTRSRGISGLVQSAAYFENKLFVATDKGVQYYDSLKGKFEQLLGFNKQTWYLLPFDNKLFIGTAKGLFVYSDNTIKQVSENNTFCLLTDPYQSNLLYAGTEDGVDIYWIDNKKMNMVTTYNLNSSIKSLASDSNKNIYFVSSDHVIYFLNYSKAGSLDSVSYKDGLPEQYFETCVFSYKGKLLLGTDSGVYALQNTGQNKFRCIKDPQFWPLTGNSQIFRATQLGNDIICSQQYFDHEKSKAVEKMTVLEYTADNSKIKMRILNHLTDVTPTLISYDSLKKIVFICANEGLFILNNKQTDEKKRFNLILKRFITKNDTLLENVTESMLPGIRLEIPYKNNDIKALLGFTSYETSNIEFCYMLEGRDNSYNKWSNENQLSFNNLAEGNYLLKIKARTELEDKEYVMEIPFKLIPPWYRSLYAYFIYFVLFIAFVYAVVKLNSKRLVALNKKLEKTIEERTSTISMQKEEIEHKQKEIMDSINYAQRIQRALLASDKILADNLPDHFVFFQPKDVVSGDFYWASLLENGQFVLVTADSTGHGVPGAIMSMLNISCLKEAVESEKLTSPGEILNHARKKIIETLANDGSAEGGKDGMDCSLICFDLLNKQFSYAAANNPVWIVRKAPTPADPQELIELGPDKMPVGKHDRDSVSFTNHIFQVQPGDMIYALTDGLPDQFGGPKGKKFMYKKLKDLLLAISQLSLKEQRNQLSGSLDEWKGELEQVDDVTLIGIRV